MAETTDTEPTPVTGEIVFEEGDFHSLSDRLAADRQYDDARLRARRKLGALGKLAVKRLAAGGLELDSRTSLHTPTVFNAMRVRRLWTYLTRTKREKARLKRTIGADLAKDLDAAYRNAYLCIAIEADALEVSLRIHPEAWFDGQNLVHRTKREGLRGWLDELQPLDGFFLRMHYWKGEWRCGALDERRLAEFLSYYKPGEHRMAVERRFPAPPGARGGALSKEAPEGLLSELERLAPLYRFTAWSQESDFLFAR
jgi:hypothetical protein